MTFFLSFGVDKVECLTKEKTGFLEGILVMVCADCGDLLPSETFN